MMTFTWEDVRDVRAGDIFSLRGKRYRLEKKTTTAISVRRWFWFDDVAAWMGRKLGSE